MRDLFGSGKDAEFATCSVDFTRFPFHMGQVPLLKMVNPKRVLCFRQHHLGRYLSGPGSIISGRRITSSPGGKLAHAEAFLFEDS